jgi:hypothetical protein
MKQKKENMGITTYHRKKSDKRKWDTGEKKEKKRFIIVRTIKSTT